MDFKQINECVSQIYPLRKYFRGIITEFHPAMRKGTMGFWIYFIPSTKMGHYICIFENFDGKLFIFDSFAQPPSEYGLYIQANCNKFAIQSDSSQNCGYFCLFFAYHSTFFPPTTVINRYFRKNSFRFNEKVVQSWLMNFLL